MSLGDRLRRERERLGLSREAFAENAGIHLNTQARYETDKRKPDSAYLETIKQLGIDTEYVLFDVPDTLVQCPFLQSIGADPAITLEDCRYNAAGRGATTGPRAMRHFRACQKCPKNPIIYKVDWSKGAPDLDGRLLAAIIEVVEQSLERHTKSLSPDSKARVLVMLYRAFKASGKIDPESVEDAIALASSGVTSPGVNSIAN